MRRLVASDEVEMLRLVAEGLTNARIGALLGISAGAVTGRLNTIGKRLGASGRQEIVGRVLEAGLAPAAPSPVVPETLGLPIDAELADQLLTMAHMIVTDQPLGHLRRVAQRALMTAAQQDHAVTTEAA